MLEACCASAACTTLPTKCSARCHAAVEDFGQKCGALLGYDIVGTLRGYVTIGRPKTFMPGFGAVAKFPFWLSIDTKSIDQTDQIDR